MELKITWKHVVKVWWAYYWRAVIIMILAFILNAMARFCIGFIGDLVGAPPGFVTFLCYLVTIICPLALSLLPMKWILGKDFGSFRLVLLAKEATDSDPSLGALNQSKSVAALVSPIKPSRMA